jgi:3-hydroxyacyl-[acyl-carrier-protein] dehydratase
MSNIDALSFDLKGIQECQQNRYPQLFIDRIVDVIPGVSARGFKNFTYNEWFFPSHFKDDPNVPGHIQIECLVQTFIMTFLCMDSYKGMKTNFVSINNAYFKRKIVPGEKLEIRAKLDSFKRGIAKGSAESFVGDEIACSADFLITLPDVLESFKPRKK